jgi:hypothetical protein
MGLVGPRDKDWPVTAQWEMCLCLGGWSSPGDGQGPCLHSNVNLLNPLTCTLKNH